MRVPSFPARAVAFHALALGTFLGGAGWLVRESRALSDRQAALELAVAVVAGGVALLSLRVLSALLRAREAMTLASRASLATYLQVLGAVALLGLIGLQLLSDEKRPALGTFCLLLATWLGMLGFQAVPALVLDAEGFLDHLGRRTRLSELEWFELRRTQGTPPRTLLRAGRGQSLYLHTRLVERDAGWLHQRLLQAGLSPQAPRR